MGNYKIDVELRLTLPMESKEELEFELEQFLQEAYRIDSFDLCELDEKGVQTGEFVATLQVEETFADCQMDDQDDEEEPTEEALSDLYYELWDHLATKYKVEDMQTHGDGAVIRSTARARHELCNHHHPNRPRAGRASSESGGTPAR